MRGIGMWDSSSISTLFSGFSSSRSSNAASSFIANMDMTTYSGIRSGSYFKLLKSYYGNNLNSKAQSLVSSSVSTSKDSAKTLASIESESEDMVKSAQALYKTAARTIQMLRTRKWQLLCLITTASLMLRMIPRQSRFREILSL